MKCEKEKLKLKCLKIKITFTVNKIKTLIVEFYKFWGYLQMVWLFYNRWFQLKFLQTFFLPYVSFFELKKTIFKNKSTALFDLFERLQFIYLVFFSLQIHIFFLKFPINKFKETSLKVKWCKVKIRRKLRMTLIKSNWIDLDIFFSYLGNRKNRFILNIFILRWVRTKWKLYKWFYKIVISGTSRLFFWFIGVFFIMFY